jgi:hypothetical protein
MERAKTYQERKIEYLQQKMEYHLSKIPEGEHWKLYKRPPTNMKDWYRVELEGIIQCHPEHLHLLPYIIESFLYEVGETLDDSAEFQEIWQDYPEEYEGDDAKLVELGWDFYPQAPLLEAKGVWDCEGNPILPPWNHQSEGDGVDDLPKLGTKKPKGYYYPDGARIHGKPFEYRKTSSVEKEVK